MRVAAKPKGRVPKDNPCMSTVAAAVSFRERHTVRTAAAEAGLSVSAYLRRRLGLDPVCAEDEEKYGGDK